MRTAEDVGAELRKVKRLLNDLLSIDGSLQCYWEGTGAVTMALWVLEGRASVSKSLEEMIETARKGMLGAGQMSVFSTPDVSQDAPGDDSTDSVQSLIPKEVINDLSMEEDA